MRHLILIAIVVTSTSCRESRSINASHFNGWPIDIGTVTSDVERDLGWKTKAHQIFDSPDGRPSDNGCMLTVQIPNNEDVHKPLRVVDKALRKQFTAKGYQLVVSDGDGEKVDIYYNYAKHPVHGKLTVKELCSNKEGGADLLLIFSEKSTKPAEQAGADQPATKPADKVPVKDQPSPPTSKDVPR